MTQCCARRVGDSALAAQLPRCSGNFLADALGEDRAFISRTSEEKPCSNRQMPIAQQESPCLRRTTADGMNPNHRSPSSIRPVRDGKRNFSLCRVIKQKTTGQPGSWKAKSRSLPAEIPESAA